MNKRNSGKHWTVERNPDGYWVPVRRAESEPHYNRLERHARERADAMNAEEDDFVRDKYKPRPPLTLQEYQESALRTWNTEPPWEMRVLIAALGLGEAGEAQELIKKHFGHGQPLDPEKLLLELGDIAYYVTVLAHECGLTLEQVLAANMKKLQKRHPNGFDPSYHQRSVPPEETE